MANELKVRFSGSWRLITQPEVKLSGSWRTIDTIEVKSGGVWRLIFGTVVSVVVAATKVISNFRLASTCHAKVKVDNDGDLYASSETGAYGASYETWLDAGLNSQVWVERTLISGTINVDDWSGRAVCSTDRAVGISRATDGVKTTIIDLKWYDASSGGNLLDTQRVTLVAEKGTL